MPKSRKGALIVFEGIDGAGKSTQAKLLFERLKKAGFDAVLSREPTGGEWGRKLRGLIESGRGRTTPEEELDWFIKDRFQHVEALIRPSLKEGKIIVLDRYYFSTMAYQGALGLDPWDIERRNREFAPEPDLLFLIEIPPQKGLQRIKEARDKGTDSFERENYLFRVSQIFNSLNKPFLHRLSGDGSIQGLSDRAWGLALDHLKKHHVLET